MPPLFYSVVGWIGTGLILAAYFFTAIGYIRAGSRLLSLMNMAGAVGIGLNVYYSHAWPALMLQIAWGLVALVSLFYSALRQPQRAKEVSLTEKNDAPSETNQEGNALPGAE